MLQKIANMLRTQLRGSKGPLDYRTWIFSSVDNRNFNYNSKYLFLYVMEHCPEITPLFVMDDDEKRSALSGRYGEKYFIDSRTARGLGLILSAGVWFTSAGLPAYELSGHPDRIVVNLWHGIPLKRIALMEEHMGKLQRAYFHRVFSSKYTDIVTTSGHLVRMMARSFGVPEGTVQVWGQPRNDVVLNGRSADELCERLGIGEDGARLVLYAPTYRDHGAVRLFPFEDYDAGALEELLARERAHICIRTHLQERENYDRYAGAHIHFANGDVIDDIAEWMGCFDVLVTDYSSIYLDYLLLNRPILFLPYDEEEYLRDRGMNFPYDKVTPGPKPRTQSEFAESLKRALEGEDGYGARRAQCSRFFNQVTGPCCPAIAERILRRIRE